MSAASQSSARVWTPEAGKLDAQRDNKPDPMLSLVLIVFFVHLAIYLVNTIGAAAIDNLLWIIYLKLPTSTSRNAKEQARVKREVVQLKREMNATSSQDEFAKWAKLRRRHDKTMEEFETLNKIISANKTSFEWTVKVARWLSTNGFKLFLQFYYSKTPVFELPPGWFPYYVEWVLSFPRAPIGTVSVQVWGSACAAAISLTGDVVASALAPSKTQKAQPVPAGGEQEADKKTQ
ncbi:retrograde vesicle-mediated transport protein Get1 [Paecilomyces variotii No. 5]|uniref:Retrograde vesicle-mediated transport protein Get1 n=1 Tax=Byssochlamys spectabilis (strain No. 5 / NBRC 109023) TaxID=1356009 RepID=V5HZM4_BYSSN|nr:retrograde vesicle-mediated transport protein Get1 [Paecilomyces variotii No. 5]